MNKQQNAVNDSTEETTTSAVKIILAWAVVMIPLAWGFIETLIKASELFG